MKTLIKIFWFFVVVNVAASRRRSSIYQVERLNAPTAELGEGPYWDVKSQSLYYIDLFGRTINRYSYNEERVYTATIDDPSQADDIGFMIPMKGSRNRFAAGIGNKVLEIDWDSYSSTFSVVRTLVDPEGNPASPNRMNDAKADWKGRLYFGSMNRNVAGQTSFFFSKGKNQPLVTIRENVGISNGIAWNCANDKMFYIDTNSGKVDIMDYNRRTGAVSNSKTYFDFGAIDLPMPDGMTIDEEDNIYVAIFNRNGVYRVNARTQDIDMEMIIPHVANTTSVAFGGPNMNELFVTTGRWGIDPSSPHYYNAGGLYKISFCDRSIFGLTPNKVDL